MCKYVHIPGCLFWSYAIRRSFTTPNFSEPSLFLLGFPLRIIMTNNSPISEGSISGTPISLSLVGVHRNSNSTGHLSTFWFMIPLPDHIVAAAKTHLLLIFPYTFPSPIHSDSASVHRKLDWDTSDHPLSSAPPKDTRHHTSCAPSTSCTQADY